MLHSAFPSPCCSDAALFDSSASHCTLDTSRFLTGMQSSLTLFKPLNDFDIQCDDEDKKKIDARNEVLLVISCNTGSENSESQKEMQK